MKPPLFLWKSSTLEAFATVEELENRYPPDLLAGQDFVACDSEGRILLACRGSDGLAVLACDQQQPPSSDTLRSILRGYLGISGMSPENLDSLSLADLVAMAYPAPSPTEKVDAFLLHQRYTDDVRSQLREVHGPSWLAGGLVAVPLLYFGTPHLLAPYCPRVYFQTETLFQLAEPFAIVASTIYVVERFLRRTTRRQFSLGELLTVVTAFCVATSLATHQSRYARLLREAVEQQYERNLYSNLYSCYVIVYYPSYPLLVLDLWFLRLPLLFGVACLAYVAVKGTLWVVRRAARCLTTIQVTGKKRNEPEFGTPEVYD